MWALHHFTFFIPTAEDWYTTDTTQVGTETENDRNGKTLYIEKGNKRDKKWGKSKSDFG